MTLVTHPIRKKDFALVTCWATLHIGRERWRQVGAYVCDEGISLIIEFTGGHWSIMAVAISHGLMAVTAITSASFDTFETFQWKSSMIKLSSTAVQEATPEWLQLEDQPTAVGPWDVSVVVETAAFMKRPILWGGPLADTAKWRKDSLRDLYLNGNENQIHFLVGSFENSALINYSHAFFSQRLVTLNSIH